MPARLLADRMLGKLARMLRTSGHDVEYVREGEPSAIAARARQEQRVLLTRDTRLVKQSAVGPYVLVRSNYPFHQARQVVRELGLELAPTFAYCVEDNGRLEAVTAQSVAGEVPAYVLAAHHEFLRCERCRRVFWPGTHLDGMRRLIAALQAAPLVADEDDEPAVAEEGEVRTLEPLVDLHQALDVLLLEHRVALMKSDLPAALRLIRQFGVWIRRHVQDENELVLPVYARHPPPAGFARGAAPEVYAGEHAKILEHVVRAEEATEHIVAQGLEGDALRVACLGLLDREKLLADLCEHHDRRERTYLYPALERWLGDDAKAEILERMVGLGAFS